MKILVISDTHGQINKVVDVLYGHPDITNVIHLGDMVRDADKIQELFPDKTFHKIRGNNDYMERAKDSMMLSMCGHNIFAAHGHVFCVKFGYRSLAHHARSLGCDIALFGHTHIYADEVIDGIRCLNPSSGGYFIITDDDISFFKY